MKTLLEELKKKQHFSSMEHPQTNEKTEAGNQMLLRGLKRRLRNAKGNWTDELTRVIWAYRITFHSTIVDASFHLTYGTKLSL